MADSWVKLCHNTDTFFSHDSVPKKQNNFFDGVSINALRESRKKRLHERQNLFPEMAGSSTNFSRSSEACLTFFSVGISLHGTSSGQLLDLGLTRLQQIAEIIKKVGEGSFGKVYQARDRATGALRAVKVTRIKSKVSSTQASTQLCVRQKY